MTSCLHLILAAAAGFEGFCQFILLPVISSSFGCVFPGAQKPVLKSKRARIRLDGKVNYRHVPSNAFWMFRHDTMCIC